MTYARSFSIASLLLLASLVYASIASAQTYSYPSTSGGSAVTNTTNRTTNTMTGTVRSATTNASGTNMGSTSGSVLGASSTNPNVPNTGAGGNSPATLFSLLWSGFAMIGGTLLLLRKSTV